MYFALFLIILNLFKLWVGRYLPLLGDEAYYHLWSKDLAFSYVDHPPMIAYFNRVLTLIFGQTEFGIRLGAIICILIATWLIYAIAKEAFGHKVGIASAVLFNLIPTYLAGGLFLTPEQPLIIFWLFSIYWAVRLFKTQQKEIWYLLGISIGLGLLSKYPMILFVPGLLLFMILSKENQHWWRKKEPYIAAGIALLIFSPVLIWNIQHSFPSFSHHGARLGAPDFLNNILYFIALQLIMFSPPLLIFTCSTFFYEFWKRLKSLDTNTLLLISLSLPAFLAFLLVSPFTPVGGHWTSTVYLGIIIVLCSRIIMLPISNWRIWANLLIIILINSLFIGYYAFLHPIPEDLKGKAYSMNYELEPFIKEADVDYVFSNQMGVGSLVAFYGKTKVYLPKGLWKQFDIWGQPELKPGDDIIYVAFDDKDALFKLKPLFRKVAQDKKKRLFAKDSDIPNKTEVFICRGYFRGELK